MEGSAPSSSTELWNAASGPASSALHALDAPVQQTPDPSLCQALLWVLGRQAEKARPPGAHNGGGQRGRHRTFLKHSPGCFVSSLQAGAEGAVPLVRDSEPSMRG